MLAALTQRELRDFGTSVAADTSEVSEAPEALASQAAPDPAVR